MLLLPTVCLCNVSCQMSTSTRELCTNHCRHIPLCAEGLSDVQISSMRWEELEGSLQTNHPHPPGATTFACKLAHYCINYIHKFTFHWKEDAQDSCKVASWLKRQILGSSQATSQLKHQILGSSQATSWLKRQILGSSQATSWLKRQILGSSADWNARFWEVNFQVPCTTMRTPPHQCRVFGPTWGKGTPKTARHQELHVIMYVVLMPKKGDYWREKTCWQVNNWD